MFFYEDNTWNWDEELSSQVLCDDESEDVAPRSEIPTTTAPTVKVFPPTKEPIEAEKVALGCQCHHQPDGLFSQVLCYDESEDVAPRSEIPATVTLTVEVLPPIKEPIEAEKVVLGCQCHHQPNGVQVFGLRNKATILSYKTERNELKEGRKESLVIAKSICESSSGHLIA
ncbi:hypothetical protein KY289_008513 [Solanum tuberosum]|nr:hypothetical protein KY289_008513 [Solanum tuberosum]